MRLVFLGSPPFATPVLARVLESSHRVVAVVARPDKPSGRGLRTEASPLVRLTRDRGAMLLQPRSTRDPEFLETVRGLDPQVLLVASWGEILRKEVLSLAPQGALNVHASLLPRHRGASPVQAAILAGDELTGITIQRMVEKLDEGDVVLQLESPVGERETAGELLERLAVMGGEAAVRALDQIESGEARFRAQDPSLATYARKINKEAGAIDWSKSAVEIERHVRAMTPWPGARTATSDGRELVLLDVLPVTEVSPRVYETIGRHALGSLQQGGDRDHESLSKAGALVVVDQTPFVATGNGLLEIRTLKPAGKVAMDGKAWLRGAHPIPGTRFVS